MTLRLPHRLGLLAFELAALGAAMAWGHGAWTSPDFTDHHGGAATALLVVAIVAVTGGCVWSFYSLFPAALDEHRFAGGVVAAALLVAALFASWGVAIRVNRWGASPPAALRGTVTDIRAGGGKATAGKEYVIVTLDDGDSFAIEVHRGWHPYVRGEPLVVERHRGPIYDWGFVRRLAP